MSTTDLCFKDKMPTDTVQCFIDISMLLSAKIGQLMREKGLNKKGLADLLTVKEKKVEKMLSGTFDFSMRDITMLEATLGETLITVVKSKATQP